MNAICLSENDINNITLSVAQPGNITIVPSCNQKLDQVCIQQGPTISAAGKIVDVSTETESRNVKEQVNLVYEIVYPEQFNLKVSSFVLLCYLSIKRYMRLDLKDLISYF